MKLGQTYIQNLQWLLLTGKDGLAVPDNWLAFPSVKDGADGVRFIEATVNSNDKWWELGENIELKNSHRYNYS